MSWVALHQQCVCDAMSSCPAGGEALNIGIVLAAASSVVWRHVSSTTHTLRRQLHALWPRTGQQGWRTWMSPVSLPATSHASRSCALGTHQLHQEVAEGYKRDSLLMVQARCRPGSGSSRRSCHLM